MKIPAWYVVLAFVIRTRAKFVLKYEHNKSKRACGGSASQLQCRVFLRWAFMIQSTTESRVHPWSQIQDELRHFHLFRKLRTVVVFPLLSRASKPETINKTARPNTRPEKVLVRALPWSPKCRIYVQTWPGMSRAERVYCLPKSAHFILRVDP